jgi:hypothetical protein
MFSYDRRQGWLISEKGRIAEAQGPIKDADQQSRNIYMTDKKDDEDNKQWDLIYVKDVKPELKNGEFNPDFGLKINTDFHIVSQMGRGRFIDIISSYTMVLKMDNGRNSQRFFFDNKTKTIKSRKSTSYSIEMKNSGRDKDMRIYSTYSRWW